MPAKRQKNQPQTSRENTTTKRAKLIAKLPQNKTNEKGMVLVSKSELKGISAKSIQQKNKTVENIAGAAPNIAIPIRKKIKSFLP